MITSSVLVESLKSFWLDVQANFKKYPVTSIFVCLFTVFVLLMVNIQPKDEWVKFVQSGLLFFIVFPLEIRKVQQLRVVGFSVIVLLLLIIHVLINPVAGVAGQFHVYMIAILFPLAYFAFLEKNENRALFVGNMSVAKAVFSVALSAVLFFCVGFLLILLDKLFDIKIPDKLISNLVTLIFVLGATMTFMAIYERDMPLFNNDRYGFLAKFFLIPSTIIYFIILYVYFIKLLIVGILPKGQVGYLVLASSIVGLCSIFISYPNIEKEKWAKLFNRFLSPSLIFPLCMVLWCVYVRINEYGVTISRYVLVVYFAWLLIICIWNTIRGYFSFRVSIQSFSLLFLLTLIVWPLSPYKVSFESQRNIVSKAFSKDDNGYKLLTKYTVVQSSVNYANGIFKEAKVWDGLPEGLLNTYLSLMAKNKGHSEHDYGDPRSRFLVWEASTRNIRNYKFDSSRFSHLIEIDNLLKGRRIHDQYEYFISLSEFKIILESKNKKVEIDLDGEMKERLKTEKEFKDFVVQKKVNGASYLLIIKKYQLEFDKKSFVSIGGMIFFN